MVRRSTVSARNDARLVHQSSRTAGGEKMCCYAAVTACAAVVVVFLDGPKPIGCG